MYASTALDRQPRDAVAQTFRWRLSSLDVRSDGSLIAPPRSKRRGFRPEDLRALLSANRGVANFVFVIRSGSEAAETGLSDLTRAVERFHVAGMKLFERRTYKWVQLETEVDTYPRRLSHLPERTSGAESRIGL